MHYFIVNPHARTGMGASIWDKVHAELVRKNIAYKVFQTKYAGHARKIAAGLTDGSVKDMVLTVIGGDGTINEVLDGIQNFDQVLFGYIPTGSANDFSRGMGIPSDPLAALDSILKQKAAVPIHIGYLETNGQRRRFGVSCGIGMDAAVCQEALASPIKKYLNKFRLGKLTYLFIALKQLFLCRPAPMVIRLDGRRIYRFKKVYFAAAMNLKYEGGGFQMCPLASARDTVLDVIVISDMSKLKILFCLPLALLGKHTKMKGVHILRCSSIDIQCPTPLCVHRDGESGGIATELCAGLEKGTLKVIIPGS